MGRSRDFDLLDRGIWPGKEELVIGDIDDETGVIKQEFRIKHGERIPPEAIALLRKGLKSKRVLEVPRTGAYTQDLIQRAIGKGRS